MGCRCFVRRISTLLVVLLGLALPPAHAGHREPEAPRSYERWHGSVPLSSRERQVLDIITEWARQSARGMPALSYDTRLAGAARRLLLSDARPGEVPIERARLAAWRRGWTDGQLAAIAWRLPAGVSMGARLRQDLSQKLRQVQANRIGVAVRRSDRGLDIVALFSLRLVKLAPLPARVPPGTEILLTGTALTHRRAPGAPRLSLAVTYPQGTTHQSPLVGEARGFAQRIAVGAEPGLLQVQIMADRGQGPEVAAQFPLGVGAEPWSPLPRARADSGPEDTGDTPDTEPDAERDPAAALTALIWGARQAHGLALPATSSALTAAATGHAHDMQGHAFFAHVSPTTGDVTQRLAAVGVHYARVAENIAAANSVDEIFEHWMQSPSHRANLLEPQATTMGVAVTAGAPPNRLLAVAVLARLADVGNNVALAQRALSTLNSGRLARHLAPLRVELGLSALAQAHSDACAASATLEDGTILVQTALAHHRKLEAAADVYRTATVDVVAASQHLDEAFTTVGVGVARAPAADPSLCVSVLYAAP